MNTTNEDLLAQLGEVNEAVTQNEAPIVSLDSTGSPLPEFSSKAAPSGHTGVTSSTEEKAIQLLGAGVTAEQVAGALGVDASRISQLLSEKSFADRVAALRYENLQKHNVRDSKYDSLEDQLLSKLEKAMPMLVKPESILKAMNIVNGAKRRGQAAPQQTVNQQNVVNLILPTAITQKFAINSDNQVIKAGDQDLLTMPSGNLLKRVEEAEAKRLEGGSNDV